MHDIRLIRSDPDAFRENLARRGLSIDVSYILDLDLQRRGALAAIESYEADKKKLSELSYKGALEKVARDQLKFSSESERKQKVSQLAAELYRGPSRGILPPFARSGFPTTPVEQIEAELNALLATIPNLLLPDVPDGAGEEDNQLVRTVGEPPAFDFVPREHDAIGPALGLDFETGVALAGARFTLLRGPAARLSRALGQFMLDVLTDERGFELVSPPLLVRDEVAYGTGQLPKFTDDLFNTRLSFNDEDVRRQIEAAIDEYTEEFPAPETRERIKANAFASIKQAFEGNPNNRRWLIPTAEVSLTNIVRERILSEAELPLRFTALTPCFRSEAGAAGRDTKGLIRQHQFDKVEMVAVTTPETSDAEHERMTACAELILERLGLPFRRMKLCDGDMGFASARTYDLEVWLPGQGRYREISSCSTCTDFQARRMNARYRPDGAKATRFVHTLNGSGLAVGRTLVAVIENGQRADGSVAVPEVLRPYLGGAEALTPA